MQVLFLSAPASMVADREVQALCRNPSSPRNSQPCWAIIRVRWYRPPSMSWRRCAGLDIDNAVIEIDGSEVPILDGSAVPFVEAIDRVGPVEVSQAPPALYRGAQAGPRRA